MISIPYKAKQFLLVLAKLLIVGGAVFYLYNELQSKKEVDWTGMYERFTLLKFSGIVCLSVLNWFFEILKWQTLVSSFQKISFGTSLVQTLGSLTASIFTPGRAGEYGAKILYYPQVKAKKIILLNFIGNGSQMAATVLFGFFGFFTVDFFADSFSGIYLNFGLAVLLLLVFIFVTAVFRNTRGFYGFTVRKVIRRMRALPQSLYRTVFQLAVLRYLIFSHQFYFLLCIFGVTLPYPTALATIFSVYFLASVLPTLPFTDVAIKGSVAVFLFGKSGVNEWAVVSVTTLMWLLNLVLPVILGSLYVLKFKFQTKL